MWDNSSGMKGPIDMEQKGLSDLEAEDTVRDWGDFIARTHWCVRNDSETHKTVLLDCTTGEAGSAIQLHQSSAFHCHFAHTCAFSLLSHTYCVQTELRWLLSNEWKDTRSYIFFKFAICSIALSSLGETCHLKRGDMVTGVADGAVAKLLQLCQHASALWCHAVWIRIVTMHQWVMNIHYEYLNHPRAIHKHNPHPLETMGRVW